MLNFNTQPYYDDFNEDKNFHRILFKPGVAVQARELTQAQSILQDQIGKFGKFVLSDGSNVSGGKYSLNTNAKSIDLKNIGTIATDIPYFTGMYVVGELSRCVSLISSADILNYYIIVKPIINGVQNYIQNENLYMFANKDEAYVYLNNVSSLSQIDHLTAIVNIDTSVIINNCSGQVNSTQFTIPSSAVDVGDIITAELDNYSTSYIVTEVGYNSIFTVNKQLAINYTNIPLTITKNASRVVMQVNVDSGVYFTNNTFVKALPQSIIPNSKTKFPSCIIGFEVVESIVDFVDDTSLLDPSQGSYNYTAPGADRYKIYLNLVSKPLINGTIDQTTITSSKFIELIRIKNGIVVSDSTDPTLGGLQDVLAKQMYDHAGNFIVSPFNISFNNSDFSHDSTKLNCTISSGKAYVFGYPFEASFPTNISLDKARKTANSGTQITNTYYGNSIRITDPSGNLPIPSTGAKVLLYSSDKYSASLSSLLGYAYIRNIDFTTTNEYGLYLYNSSVPQQKMSSIKSMISIGEGSFSANTILNSQNQTVVKDPTFDKLLFKLKYPNVASISSIRATLDLFTTVNVSSNTATISTGSTYNQFPTGDIASLSTEDKIQNFIVVAKSTNGAYTAGQYIDLSEVTIETKQITNNHQAIFTFNNGYTGQIDVKYTVVYTAAQKKVKTLHTNQVSKINVTTYPTSIGYSDIVKFKKVFKSSNPSVIFVGDWDTDTTYGTDSVVRYGDKLFASTKNSNIANIPNAASSNWNVLQDVTNKYKLSNGQTEFMYDFGTVTAKTPDASGTIFVIFDYYSHSTNGEYIAFDSYPLEYNEIPKIKINNVEYALRDYIDFRPRRQNSDNSDAILFDSYKIPSSTTDTNLEYSMSYYLGRIDKLILTKDKKLSWLSGESAYQNYVPPKDIIDTMTIATVQFDPYSQDLQAIKVKYAKHRRYTMDDIGELDSRLQNVEYYTALNLVEKAALSTNIIDEYGTRLKNGFIVDPFINFTIIDLSVNNKNICLDLENGVARPSFLTKKYKAKANFTLNETALINKNNLIAFNYTEVPVITQNQATGIVKVNQFDAISYAGDLYLKPQRDVWTEEAGPTINNVNQDTAAFLNASEVPGLVFNDWNSIFSSYPYTVDKDISGVTVNYNNVNYDVKAATVVTKSTQLEILAQNVIPKSRSIKIEFKATGLAPLTKMFAYVNGHLVNAYITPNENPLGVITSINIMNPGSGYTSGAAVSINNTSTIPATFNVNVVAGAIESITVSNKGRGYPLGEILSVQVTGANTNTAIINASTVPSESMNLYANENGICSGTLILPNSLLSFDVGELVLTICDTPHYDLQNAIAKSHATFYTKTSYYQNVVDSIRLPYISKKDSQINQAAPSQTPLIIVPLSTDYLVFDYSQPYSNIQGKSLSIPVYLSQAPTSDVVVSILKNASEDIYDKSTIDVQGNSVLTFTPQNYATIQYFTLNYNLGDRRQFNDGTYFDNNLPSHIEFYGTSSDSRYNYSGSAIPIKSWLSNTPIKAVASTHLVPYKKYDPNAGPAAEVNPYIILSNIVASNVAGESFFTVSYGGGKEIGWWTDSTTTYPLIFTATVANTSCAMISHSTYEDYESKDFLSGKTRTIQKSDEQILEFKYWLYGVAQGTTSVTVSVQSANLTKWNGVSNTATIVVGPALLEPTAQVVVHPNAEIKSSTGVVLNSARITSSTGTTQILGISLSKQPTSDVTVTATSSKTAGGGTIFKVSDDGLTSETGSSVTFTSSTWDHVKTITVKGSTDPTLYHQQITDYNVVLTTSSVDSEFNSLSTTVPMKNNDAGTTAPVIPAPTPTPTYNSVHPTLYGSSFNEGTSIEYTVETSNVPNGTWLYWKINNSMTTNADFNTTQGAFQINNNNKGTFNVSAATDSIYSEGTEVFTVSIYTDSGYSTPAVLTSATQGINDMTATPAPTPTPTPGGTPSPTPTPTPAVPTYSLTANVNPVTEGNQVYFTLHSSNAVGMTLYWRLIYNGMTCTIDDFYGPISGSFVVPSDGIYTFGITVNTDTVFEGSENFEAILSTTPGGTYISGGTSGNINIVDAPTPPPVQPPPVFITPTLIIGIIGEHATQNNADGVHDVILQVKLTSTPQPNKSYKVTFTSNDTVTGGTLPDSTVLWFTTSNWGTEQPVRVVGANISGSTDTPVSYKIHYSSQEMFGSGLSVGGGEVEHGDVDLVNKRYKYSTSTLVYTETTREYLAKVVGSTSDTWGPTGTISDINWVVEDVGHVIGTPTVTIVEKSSNYFVAKINATVKGALTASASDGGRYHCVAMVQAKYTPISDTIITDGECTLSIQSIRSLVPLPTNGRVQSLARNPGDVQTLQPHISWPHGEANFKAVFEVWNVSTAVPVEVLVKVSGFCLDTSYPNLFEVNECKTTTTTSISYRTDTYEVLSTVISSPVALPLQSVSWNLNSTTLDAVNRATMHYPRLNSGIFPTDVPSMITYKNQYYIGVYQNIVDKLTEFVNTIIAKNPAVGTPAYETLQQEKQLLAAYRLKLNSYTN